MAFGMGTKHPLTKDVRVRKALAMSVDRSQIKKFMSDMAEPVQSWVPSGLLGSDPNRGLAFNPEEAKKIWKLTSLGMELLNDFAHNKSNKNYNFSTKSADAIFFSQNKSDKIQAKYNVYKQIGADVELIENAGKMNEKFHQALVIKNEGKTNNQAILRKLRYEIRKNGGKIFNNTEVTEIIKESETIYKLKSKTGKIVTTKKVLIATGGYKNFSISKNWKPNIPSITTYVARYEYKTLPSLFSKNVLWDTNEPFHYIRTFKGRELWVGGEDNVGEAGNKKEYDLKINKINKYVEHELGLKDNLTFMGSWSGTFYPTKRTVPYIFESDDGVLYSIGFGGSGLVMSFVSGYLHSEWNKNRMLEYKKIFSEKWE
jgi:glycine/D-amino acid oxidase-like deaminating enzyme